MFDGPWGREAMPSQALGAAPTASRPNEETFLDVRSRPGFAGLDFARRSGAKRLHERTVHDDERVCWNSQRPVGHRNRCDNQPAEQPNQLADERHDLRAGDGGDVLQYADRPEHQRLRRDRKWIRSKCIRIGQRRWIGQRRLGRQWRGRQQHLVDPGLRRSSIGQRAVQLI